MDKLLSRSVAHLARVIESGEASSRDIVSAFLERVEAVNPTLNAVVLRDREAVLRDADDADRAMARGMVKGPLHGVPMTIKDNLDTAEMVTTGGTIPTEFEPWTGCVPVVGNTLALRGITND